MIEETRVCNLCNKELPISLYGKYKNRSKVQYRRRCRDCRRIESAKRYAENPEVKKRMKQRAKRANIESYGITEQDYNDMLAASEGKCAICQKTPERALNIDHCHETNIVRGLLCWNCNTAIGKFFDNVVYLERAILYLKGEIL